MPWREVDTMSLRLEFVTLAKSGEVSFAELCRRFGVSRKTGYKWCVRYEEADEAGLRDRPRRPHCSPRRTPAEMEAAVLALRRQHPRWGGRKLRRVLQRGGLEGVPSASTVTEILRRHGELEAPLRAQRDWQRFEASAPNELWQMDFKGHVPTRQGGRCYPLTLLDDHSRFALGLRALSGERRSLVQPVLEQTFERYGRPFAILTDHGKPWGNQFGGYTGLGVWLLKLDIGLIHCRVRHPQTLGKDERFHRSLKAEVLSDPLYRDLIHCQQAFDRWRRVYNFERPHDALGLEVPAERYVPSSRPYQAHIEAFEYAQDDQLRKVRPTGQFQFKGHTFKLSEAFRGETIAMRPTPQEGCFEVVFRHHRVGRLSLREPEKGVTHVSERV